MNSILGFDPSSLSVFQPEAPKEASEFSRKIYHPRPADSKSSDGIYRATIRVIYSPQNLQESILERQSYALQDANGYFQVVSKLTKKDKSCPVFTAWKQCRYSENPVLSAQSTPKEKGGNGLFEKRFERYVTVQVIDDPNNPDLNGSYLFWKMPKFIYDTISSKMTPPEESGKASIPVMDFLFGRLIYLEVKPGPDDPNNPERKVREISYNTSEVSDDIQSVMNPDKTPILNAEQQAILDKYVTAMSAVWKSRNKEERAKMQAEINSDPNTAQLAAIYTEVVEKLKTFVPDLNAELGYKEWSPEMTTRVNNWIKIVLEGNDPAKAAPVAGLAGVAPVVPAEGGNITAPATAATVATSPAAGPAVAAAPAVDDDDLPF